MKSKNQILLSALVMCTLFCQGDWATTLNRGHAISGMLMIETIFSYNKRLAPHDVASGTEASIACMDVVFNEWYELYNEAELKVLTPGERSGGEFLDFQNYAKETQEDLNSVFDANRPGLTQAIEQVLTQVRSQNEVPSLPSSLTVEDIQQNLFTVELQACETPAFLQEVSGLVPPISDANKEITRVMAVQVPDGGPSSGFGLWVPTHTEMKPITATYADWISRIIQGN